MERSIESAPNNEVLRGELEVFLMSVGERVLAFRREMEQDPDFAKLKADKSLVTKADELSETLIREWITARFPNDSIRGEEQADKAGNERVWIVDPIDGTYNFTHFGEKFGISVGLFENGSSKLGIIFYPAEKVMLASSADGAVLLNGEKPMVAKGASELSDATIIGEWHPLHRDSPYFAKTGPQTDRFLATVKHRDIGWSMTNTFREFLAGTEDAILYPGLTPYDVGAIIGIAQGLGMSVSGYDGAPVNLNQEKVPIVISKNETLHKAIIAGLNS